MPKIMLVDDEGDIRRIFSIALKRNGFEVVSSVGDGSEAVAEFQKNREVADIVIMDHRMPIMCGDEAAREIKKINPGIKVILLSAYQDVSYDKGLFESTLRKPVSMKKFVSAINMALSQHSSVTVSHKPAQTTKV